MIEGTANTENIYRKLLLDSSSSLKDFSLDRKKYYCKHIMAQTVEDKDTQAAIMGRVVETLLLEPELFDNKFYLSSCANPPTAMMLDFVICLVDASIDGMDEETGEIRESFLDVAQKAYYKSRYKISLERVLKNFEGTDAEIYFNELLKVKMDNLTVITSDDVTNAERIVEELKTNPITSGIVNLVNSLRWEIKNQFQVEGYVIDGHTFKSMLDKVVIDHKEKKIDIYDLKCVWAVEGFYSEYYLYRRAYIQAYLYYQAIISLTLDKTHDWYRYNVNYPKFIVCDSINYFSPLIYTMDDGDMKDAYMGFEHKGKEYPGVKDLIQDLKWALENNIWNISRKNYLSNGVINIKD